MEEMKTDMSGGATVLAAIDGISRLKLKINVTAVVPAVENMPDGGAIRPSDILKALTGKTIETKPVYESSEETKPTEQDSSEFDEYMKLKKAELLGLAGEDGNEDMTKSQLVELILNRD